MNPGRTAAFMTPATLIFYGLAALALGCAAGVAFSRNILHSALALLGTLTGVAGLYLYLGADFLGMAQLLIYVGGILVLMLFAVLLTTRIGEVRATNHSLGLGVALPVAAVVGGGLVALAVRTPWSLTDAIAAPTTGRLGDAFLREDLLPFELVSVILLMALVGAMVLARRALRAPARPRRQSLMSALAPVGLPHFLVLSALLFALGLVTVSTRKSAVAILMGVELMLNAAALNFVAFSHYVHGAIAGQVVALFVVVHGRGRGRRRARHRARAVAQLPHRRRHPDRDAEGVMVERLFGALQRLHRGQPALADPAVPAARRPRQRPPRPAAAGPARRPRGPRRGRRRHGAGGSLRRDRGAAPLRAAGRGALPARSPLDPAGGRSPARRLRAGPRSAVGGDDPGHHAGRHAHPRVRDRVHEGRRRPSGASSRT